MGYTQESQKKRYNKLKLLPNNFEQWDYDYMVLFLRGECIVCGTSKSLCSDHFIPVSKDKTHGTVPTNIILLCRSCNSKKANKMPDEWFATFEQDERERIEGTIMAYFSNVKRWRLYDITRQPKPLFTIRDKTNGKSNPRI